jgi:hypothetical protein
VAWFTKLPEKFQIGIPEFARADERKEEHENHEKRNREKDFFFVFLSFVFS